MENAPLFRTREDKLSKYMEALSKDFLFDELSADYIREKGISFMKGIAVPFRASDLVALKEKGIDASRIADNMAVIIGSNTAFLYADSYMKYMAAFFSEKLIDVFSTKGAELLMGQKDYRKALSYYRMALMLDHKDKMAMFGYACACREWYLSMEGEDGVEELISILRSEATEYFEWCIIEHPSFAPAYYYLGFAYLNAALYSKAQFIWTRFTELSENKEKPECKEIEERIKELDDPVRIEQGINKLTVGDLSEGLKILEPYTESEYKKWWPLHYYLACTYRELEQPEEAIEGFKKVLSLDPSNYDACKALAEIYGELGDGENGIKYAKKCEIIMANRAE